MKTKFSGFRAVAHSVAFLLLVSGYDRVRADQGLIPYVTAIPREQEADALTFAVFQVERWDSNLFRLPNDVATPDGKRRSAVTNVSGFGVNFDKRYAQQRFLVNAAITRSLYSGHSELDETSKRLDATWDWTFTPAITGEAALNYFKTPTDYEYAGSIARPNPQTTKNAHVSADIDAGSGLHPRLAVVQAESRTEDATFQVSNSRTDSGEAGLVYQFRSGNELYAFASRGRGRSFGVVDDPVTQVGTTYDQTEFGIRYKFRAEDRWTVDGYVSRIVHSGEAFTPRNFDATTGEIAATYAITGKTRLEANVARKVYGAASTFSSYFVEDTLRLGPAWDITGKLTLHPEFIVRRQRYGGAIAPVDNVLRETSRYTNLRLDYAALRALDLAFELSKSGRTANASTLQYRDRSASVFARIKF